MADILPFRALRYDLTRAGALETVCCPPYDIISSQERRVLLDTNPHNAIRLEKPTEDSAVGRDEPYIQAAGILQDWKAEGILTLDGTPAFYGLTMTFFIDGEEREISGFLARVKLHDFADNVILPHEETLSGDKADRLSLLSHTQVQFSPLMGFVSDADIAFSREGAPTAAFTMSDGVTHRMWRIDKPEEIARLTKAVAARQILIADGHHRYETMLRYSRSFPDGHPARYTMFALLSMEQPGLTLFGTHRLLLNVENVLPKVSKVCTLEEVPTYRALGESIGVYDGQKTYRLQLKTPVCVPGKSDAYNSLAVTELHSGILEPCLGITPEKMASGAVLHYTRSAEEAVEAVRGGQASAAFFLPPTKMSQMRDVSFAGEKMPQKSTYFYPKLITGLVMNDLSV